MIYTDYPQKGQLGFQDPGSEWMYAIIDLHDRIVFYQIILCVQVGWMMISAQVNKEHLAYMHHGNLIEQIWTQSPAGIQWAIGLPSQTQLYMMAEIQDAEITIKAIGNQWYWSYEYSDYIENDMNIAYDSFQVDQDSLEEGDLRQQTVDNYLVQPVNTSIRLLVSSNDVIHCFAVPSLGQKTDAIPGRQNATGFIINRPSTFYGQCSELCGVLHGFMPIGIHAVNIPSYLTFQSSANE